MYECLIMEVIIILSKKRTHSVRLCVQVYSWRCHDMLLVMINMLLEHYVVTGKESHCLCSSIASLKI